MDCMGNLILILFYGIVVLPTPLLPNLWSSYICGLWTELNWYLFAWLLAVKLFKIQCLLKEAMVALFGSKLLTVCCRVLFVNYGLDMHILSKYARVLVVFGTAVYFWLLWALKIPYLPRLLELITLMSWFLGMGLCLGGRGASRFAFRSAAFGLSSYFSYFGYFGLL